MDTFHQFRYTRPNQFPFRSNEHKQAIHVLPFFMQYSKYMQIQMYNDIYLVIYIYVFLKMYIYICIEIYVYIFSPYISIYVLVSYEIYMHIYIYTFCFLSLFDCANLSKKNYDLVEVRRAFDSDLAAFLQGLVDPGSLNATKGR